MFVLVVQKGASGHQNSFFTVSSENASLEALPRLAFGGLVEKDAGGVLVAAKGTDNLNNINTTSIAKEGMADRMVSQMEKPIVSDATLSKKMDELFRDNAQIGNGSTGAAVRYELETGQPIGGVWHMQKAQETIVFLQKWLDKNPAAAVSDRMAAEQVMRDLQNALKGK